jgi:hypothetical protein
MLRRNLTLCVCVCLPPEGKTHDDDEPAGITRDAVGDLR